MKKQILFTSLVIGSIITAGLILLSLFVPILGIPILIIFLLVWIIATIMRLSGVKNIHLFGGKFIDKD